MNRNITGTIRKTDGAVWAGAVVEFELERSTYDGTAQYPMRAERAVADENGELQLSLWVNEEALRPSRYICTLPDGSQFRFTLPEGSGAADLNELRESAIEEDSPTQNTMVAFIPVVRNVAQEVVDQSLVAVNAEIDTKADQSALDATNDTVAQVVTDLDTLHHEVDDKASQANLNTTNANLAALGAVVDTKANQSGLNATNANVGALMTGLDATNTAVAAANSAIATKASQTALDATNVNLAALDAEVDTKADQSALDTTNTNVGDLTDSLFSTNANVLSLTNGLTAANSAIATKANQSALDATNANVTTVTNGLAAANSAIATKANQSALNTTNSNLAGLSATVDTKAAQSSLDDTNNTVSQVVSDVNTLAHEVNDKVSHAELDATNSNVTTLDAILSDTIADLAAANAAIDTKANQSALNTTNANVTTLTSGLATANDEIAIRARQTALNTTNSNLAALSTVVDTKASQADLNTANAAIAVRATTFQLNVAVNNLQNAISDAEATLGALIDLKADLEHTHEPGDITTTTLSNSIGYFDADGVFTGSGNLVFAQDRLGLGTGDPEHTLDLRHAGGMIGSNSRITAALDASGANLKLWSDPNIPAASTIDLESNGYVNTIDSDVDGSLGLGQEGSTPDIYFRMLNSTISFRGFKAGVTEPTQDDFPPTSFGFYLMQEPFNLDGTLFLVFSDGHELKKITFKS